MPATQQPIRRALVSVFDKSGIVAFATALTDPGDYDRVLAAIASNGGEVGAAMRRELARKAFATTAAYDAAIAEWMAHEDGVGFPETMVVGGRLAQRLHYGENPHQAAAFYR